MKRNAIAFILVVGMMLLACGCGGKGKGEDVPGESTFSFKVPCFYGSIEAGGIFWMSQG
ncbi:MAG: hypothetical protein HDQ99_17865 [Lachnospiraceae bacterium]|nr:hypothetical protein [Lachnospiraceae bacterium]